METQVREETNAHRARYWLITLVSFVAFILFLIYKPEWFWVTLPFLTTYLVKALGMM